MLEGIYEFLGIGNTVVSLIFIQHALEEWGGRRCQAILQKMEGRVMQLSIQKFSSNVVEKLFSLAPADFRKRFIGELVASEKMSTLVNSTYGHYVVRRALQMATPEQSEALIKAVRANLEMLPSKRLWVKWENVISGQADWEGEHLKGPKPRSKKREQYPQFSRWFIYFGRRRAPLSFNT